MNENRQGNQVAIGASAALAAASRFWRWWRGELLGLLPQGWRRNLEARGEELRVDLDAAFGGAPGQQSGQARLLFVQDGQVMASEERLVKPKTGELGDALRGFRERNAITMQGVTVSLPASRAIVKILTLPKLAERTLGNVLGFEMDRHTPFRAEDVYFAYRIIERDTAAASLKVELTAVPRVSVDALLEEIAEAGFGVSGLVVRLPVTGTSASLLPGSKGTAQGTASGRWRARLAWMAMVLAVACAVFPLAEKQLQLNVLERRVDEVRGEAMQAQAARDRLVELANPSKEFLARRAQTPIAIAVLDELSRIIPDGTWLDRYELSDGVVTMQGESEQAAALLSLIEASDLFRGAQFASTINRNVRTNKDRFVIEVRLQGGQNP